MAKKMRKSLVWCWRVIKQYLCNSGIHGFRYLADDQFSIPERLFWLVACCLCWWGCASMIKTVIDDALTNPVAIVAETAYIEWQTPFPSVAFCITTTTNIKKKYYKMKPGMLTNHSAKNAPSISAEELLEAYDEMKMPCSELLFSCTWNDKKFDCCKEFRPMYKTGLGYCLAFNSVHSEEKENSALKYFVNQTVRHGDLITDVTSHKGVTSRLDVYLLNNFELPLISTEENRKIKLRGSSITYIPFILESVTNQNEVKSVAIHRRACRFSTELNDNSYFNVYTRDSCRLQVMVEQMLSLCGCVHFYYYTPSGTRTCNMTELQCIVEHKAAIMSIEKGNSKCDPDCESTGLSINHLEPYANDEPDVIKLHFSLLSRPTLRHRRYVVHDILDVVVTVGGAVGLFMGASILSIFEIPYWLFIRRDKMS